MDLAELHEGMTVADIGAGAGYYTVRLAERVGSEGRVLAQDIDREALERLGRRAERERPDHVSIKTGSGDHPHLPAHSLHRIARTSGAGGNGWSCSFKLGVDRLFTKK